MTGSADSPPPVPVRVPFFKHGLGKAELDEVEKVLCGPILTTGQTVAEFEQRFAAYLGHGEAVGLTSCTAALQLALTGLGIGAGSEVITTPMTFIATATAILQAGAEPVFVDVEPTTGNLDATLLEGAITSRTRAIVPVHLYGQMCDMETIGGIAKRHGIDVIEDAAHCIEGSRDGIRPGDASRCACFSFYATKSLASGEGGALVTDDAQLAESTRLLRLHGMTQSAATRERHGYRHWDMVMMGWKYNMDNIHAALLLPQFESLDERCARRQALASRYLDNLASVRGVSCPQCLGGTNHARHLFTVWVDPEIRDFVVTALQHAGVQVMVNYRAIHLLTYFAETYGYAPGSFPVAEHIGASTISLPLFPSMSFEQVDIVSEALEDALASA